MHYVSNLSLLSQNEKKEVPFRGRIIETLYNLLSLYLDCIYELTKTGE